MKWLRRGLITLGILGVLGAIGGYYVWTQAFQNNIRSGMTEDFVLLIPPGADFETVMARIEAGNVLEDVGSFRSVAKFRQYPGLVKPGRYVIPKGSQMSNWDLVQKLRAGAQDQMKFSFRTHRTLEDLAAEISDQFMFEKDDLLAKMQDDAFLKAYGVNSGTVRNLFIPNTYFVYWTMEIEDLFQKMKGYYDQFWNADRLAKAEKLGMTVHQVVTLASIVQAETYIVDERPTVAGLYLNRLRKNIPLQADPTVIYAVGDFTIKRVLNKHLEVDSPYNTYKNTGLPPGPINNPEASAINGVLDYEDHPYIFMCAKADFSGRHNFSKTLAQHNRYAREYQAALNKQKVYR